MEAPQQFKAVYLLLFALLIHTEYLVVSLYRIYKKYLGNPSLFRAPSINSSKNEKYPWYD